MTDSRRQGTDSRRSPDETREGEWTEPDGGSSLQEIAAALEELKAKRGYATTRELSEGQGAEADTGGGAATEIAATLDHVRAEKQAEAREETGVFPTVPYGTPEACSAFASGLDDQSLGRALTVFEQLQVDGRLQVDQLAETLGLPTTGLWGTVSNPIKRRADAVDLPMPYEVIQGPVESWVDSENVAPGLVRALRREMGTRLEPLRRSYEPRETAAESRETESAAEIDPRAAKYAALTARLEQLEKGERRFSLEQIEAIIGFELPPKAWADVEWWANDAALPYLRHSEAWLRVGWHAFPDLGAQVVAFRPDACDAEISSQGGARRGLGGLAKKLFGSGGAGASNDTAYSERVCEEFAAGLSDSILMRAERLFGALAKHGEIESAGLAKLLGSETSRLGGQLATPLRRRAHVLALEPPYEIAVSSGGSRVWRPAAGAGTHLSRSLTKELRSR